MHNLPPSIVHQTSATLCASLPPPVADTPESRAARDETAIAAAAALHPADAFEAQLAAQIVDADAHAKDCLRLAVQSGQQPADIRRHRTHAIAMMRQMHIGLRALQRIQAMRAKSEPVAHPAAMERAAPADVSVPAPAPARAATPDPAAPPHPGQDETSFGDHTEAEQYAVLHPERAAHIRAHGSLPPSLDCGPPVPEIVEALVNGTSPIRRALDRDAATA
jgi:hypothetical protein